MSTTWSAVQDRVLVVLDDDDRVAEVAQVLQRVEQARIVALVQADRGLVEHVEHAGQARADLRGEADALALAARQRAGVARQRQIVEADIVQEAQPLADFLQDAAGDLVLLGGSATSGSSANQRAAPCGSTFSATSPICSAGDLDRQRLRLQAVAVAGRAGRLGDMKRSISSRIQAESVSFQRRSRLGMTPSKVLVRLVGAQAVVIDEA